MKTVQKANKQLRVADERMDEMKKLGFVEINPETGKPIVEPESPLAALKKENTALKKENKTLKAELEKLKAGQ